VALVQTNIVRITVGDPRPVLAHLAEQGVLAVPGSADTVRLVTHADIDDADLDRAVAALESAP
jgi:threonine aldolase